MKNLYSFLFIVLLFISDKKFSQSLSCQHQKAMNVATPIYNSPENRRSDTIDILNYTISLDIRNYTGQTIAGNTVIRFAPKINGQDKIRLDLLKMTIDSVKHGNVLTTYSYNDTLLKVNLLNVLNTIDTNEVTVYYHGFPQGDPAGWGGFSFSGTYAYNLGVGFGANPHNYGRVWFPCFDNFVEKSKYEFNIITDTTKKAYCNGQLIADIKTGNIRTRSWKMEQEIPTYLASVAVADYTQVNWNVNAANGNLPIVLAARANDTIGLKNGFVHLPNAILGFENYFGPYMWNRVGYCLVPFSSGAMEHATNIAYPRDATAIAYESELMAHELAHHWWGNLMTCETQEDMWLNEGMATYSAYLFQEWVYNYGKYLSDIKTVHDDIVKYIHIREKGFRAISGVPHEYTYGDHVYKKGADVAHTLRSYMGDAAFFTALKYALQQKAYKNMHSIEFRDLLQSSSGQDLTDFFNNWVMNGGWPHFSIDSVKTSGTSAPYTSVVHLKQKLFGAPSLYSNVPLELTFMNSAWSKEVKTVVMSGATQSFTVQTNLLPVYAGINVESKISDAISSEYKTIKTNSNINYVLGRAIVMVSNKGVDSSLVRIEHNFAAPDPIQNNINNYRINTQHYWKIDGILSSGFVGKLRLYYDGNKNPSGNGYLDTCLTIVHGDSIILLYRKNASDDWHEVKNYTKFRISSKTGFFTADTLKLGEYVFANGMSTVITNIKEEKTKEIILQLYPNPTKQELHVGIINPKKSKTQVLEIIDIQGRSVITVEAVNDFNTIDVSKLSTGLYKVRLMDSGKTKAIDTFVVEK